jgi:hypothetical protein
MPAVTRRTVAITLDILTVALLVLAATIVHVGGFIVQFSDFRISFRTPSRTLLWIVVFVLVRLIVDRRNGPFGLAFRSLRPLLRLPTGADPCRVRAAPGLGRRITFASLGLALALAILMHDQLTQPYAVADLGDPLFSMWRIGWVLHQLVAGPSRLFDANIFYPQRLTLTFSDPIILPALTAAPLLAVGAHPVVVYNLVLLSGFWFSGIATYVLVERLTASPRAAFIAGLMYACSSYRFEHYGHFELQMTQWMPLGLLALHLFVSTGRWPYALALGLAGVAQLYSCMYYAVFFLVYVAAIGAGLLVVQRPSVRRLVLPAVTAAVVAGLLAVPLVRAFVAAQPLKGDRPTDEIRFYSATPFDYLRANRHSALWHGRTLPPKPERALFPGVTPLALAGIGLAPPLSAIRLVYAGGLLVSLDGSFGFNGVLYPHLHRWLPPIRGLRVPARWSALAGLTLAIFAGFGVRRVLGWCRSRTSTRVILAALVAAVMIDAWPALKLTPVWREPPPVYEVLNGRPDTVLAEFPVTANEVFNIPFMYFSLWHWSPMLNGYSGFIPQSYATVALDLLEFPRGNTVAALRRRGVTHVTLNCGLQYGDCDETMNLMRQSADLRLIAEARWEGEPVQLFELAGD